MPGNAWQPKGRQPEEEQRVWMKRLWLTGSWQNHLVYGRSGGLAQKKGSLTCFQKVQNSGEHLPSMYSALANKRKRKKGEGGCTKKTGNEKVGIAILRFIGIIEWVLCGDSKTQCLHAMSLPWDTFSVFSIYAAMAHVLLIMLGDSSYYYLHFIGEETEAERNK